ncbi:MAG: hypothetical protein ACRD0Z_14275 [Acidimicrobiales bacterium]
MTLVILIVVLVLAAAGITGWKEHWPSQLFAAKHTPPSTVPAVVTSSTAPTPTTSSLPTTSTTPTTTISAAPTPTEFMDSAESLMSFSKDIRMRLNKALKVATCTVDPTSLISGLNGAVTDRKTLLAKIATLRAPTARMGTILASFNSLESAKLIDDLAYQSWAARMKALFGDGKCYSGATTSYSTDHKIIAAEALVTKRIAAYLSLWNSLAPSYNLPIWKTGDSSTI